MISTWKKTSILSPCPYVCVLCSCEHGMPCVRRLHSGDMSPCVSADCVEVTEIVDVSAHDRVLGGLKTSSMLVGPWACGAGVREPCSSLENTKKDSVERPLADLSRGMHRHASASLPRLVCDEREMRRLTLFLFLHHTVMRGPFQPRVRTHTPSWGCQQVRRTR